MACRFAGAPDLHAYWDLTLAGRDAFGPIPPDRWSQDAFFDDSKRATDKTYASAGGFLDDIRSFPALYLGIPPRRVEVMDPQQRMSIEIAVEAIADAGYAPSEMPHRTGVYVGVTAMEFRQLVSSRIMMTMMATGQLGRAPDDPEVLARLVEKVVPSRPYSAPGVLANMIAAAVAQELDLHGPAYTIDAACASGLVAVADAIGQLRSGTIDAAVASGVYLQLTPENYVAFSRIGAMSRSGKCLPFDARADGFVQGEGGGALVLKRLEDALRDGDRVYAVVHGVATNNDGRGDGPMAPVMNGQRQVITDAWDDAGADPRHLGYLESHGTGTEVGDVTELHALREALGDRIGIVHLGSAKANVGHTMSAAGIAGLVRAVLAVYHKRVPPMAGFESAKEDLGLDGHDFVVPTAAVDWTDAERLAGVSSFGFGGTNVHAVVGPAPAAPSSTVAEEPRPELVCLSAPDEVALRATAARLATLLAAEPVPVASVAAAWATRPALAWRTTIVAAGTDELVAALRAIGAGEIPAGVSLGERWADPPRVALLFPGQGAQRIGMLGGLRDRFPVVREAIEEAERDLDDLLRIPLSWLLWPERRPERPPDEDAEAELLDTAHCQPALVAAGLAGWKLLESVGVRPVAVAGHSLGEFAAAAVGGTLSPRDAVRFAARRGRLMADVPGDRGAMAALRTDARGAEALLVDGVVVANENHPRQVVVSGRTDAIREVVRRAENSRIEAKQLAVSHAFHSPIFGALDVEPLLGEIEIREPNGIVIASGIASSPYASAADARAVFLRHAISPVRYQVALEQCADAGAELFVQVGAGGPLASFARTGLGERARAVLTLASSDDTDRGRSALETLGWMWTYGVPLDRKAIVGPAMLASLPPVVLPREPYWPVKDEAQLALKLKDLPSSAPGRAPAPAPDRSADTRATDDVYEQVATIVARVSSYPRAAIRPELGLVDALGFDSLMVADLATGLAEVFPGLGGLPQELLLDKPTVQRIADHVRAARGGGVPPTDDDLPLGAWRPTWRPCPLPESRAAPDPALAGRTVLLLEEADAALRAALERAGARVTRRTEDAVDLVVFAAPFEDPVAVSSVMDGTAELLDPAGVLLAALEAQVHAGAAPGVVVVRRADDPWAEAASGVVRALAREWPERVHKSLSFEALSADARAARIMAELVSEDRTPDVSWTRDGRFVLGQEPIVPSAAWEPGPADAALVTGGTRGIGRKIAERLLAAGARVVVVGRGDGEGPPGATVVRADVTDRLALMAACAPHLPFTAVVHCAGVLADGAAGRVDPQVGLRARRTKIAGLLNAVRAAGPSVHTVLALGSWAGRFGSRHQTHYAAANAGMSALAPHLGVRTAIAETGPWSSSDMVRTVPGAVQAALRADGVDFVGDAPGLEALWSDLRGASGVVVHGRRVPWWNRVRVHEEVVSTDTHPYLRDHAIDGTPILPLAVATDLCAEVAGVPRPFEVADLQLYQGVAVSEPVRIKVTARGERVEIRSGERDTLCYRAVVRPAGPVEEPAPVEVGKLPDTTLAAFYGGITFHGPALRGIAQVDGAGAGSVRGAVRTSRPREWIPDTKRETWAVDPLALDSAFQLGALVAWDRFRRAGTPVSLRRMVVFDRWDGPLTVEARFGEPKDDRFAATFVLRDAAGRMVGLAEEAVAELRAAADGAAARPAIKKEWVDPTAWPEVRDLEMRLEAAAMMGVENPYFHVHEGTARNTTVVGGRSLVNFSSYNYVGLSGDPRVLDAVREAIDRYGTSVSASRVASGERPYHGELERGLAEAQGVDDAIVFTAGHMTNVNAIGTIMKPADLVLHDELAHDSLLQGIRLSGAKRRAYRHEDPEHLEKLLREIRGTAEKCLIVVEGVYSMDGDLCALPAFVRIKKEYGCLLMVDEAHSFGVCGPTGRGIGEHHQGTVDPRDVDLWMGTLSKSLASCGGWIGGSATLVRYLRYSAGGFVYSAGLTPANGVAALTSLRLMLAEPWRVETLQHNARMFHAALTRYGLDTGPARGGSAVVPVITGNSLHAMMLSQRLRAAGVNVQPIVYPAVPDQAARLRFFLSCLHTDAELADTAELVAGTLAGVRAEFPA